MVPFSDNQGDNGKGGVFQYDFGKTIQDQTFRTTGFLNQPPALLRSAVSDIRAQYEGEGHQLENAINSVLERKPKLRKKYKRPDPSSDRLYKSEVTHLLNDERGCGIICGDDPSKLVFRFERAEDEDNPAIHYGLIVSANQLIKDALVRDRLTAENDVLCFEMEAAGLINHFPCLVIRGICDYSDSHKNNEWQGYAAMAAAAYTKDLLRRIPPSKVEPEKRIEEILSGVQMSVDTLLRVQRDQELNAILNWLTPVDYAPQQNDYIKRRQPGTGQWLLDSAEYQAWVRSDEQTLFCPDSNTGIAYIYCNFRRQDQQKVDDLLASLLKQFIESQPSLLLNVKDLYNRHKARRTLPSVDEISRVLEATAAKYSRVFVVIDALDECQMSNGSRERFLFEIFNLQSKVQANLFVTSRFIPEIIEKFSERTSVEIRAREVDIQRYLSEHLSQLPVFVRHSSDLQAEIKNGIVKAVDGMFLLGQLHLNSLKGKRSPKAIRTALTKLAAGSDAYDHAYMHAMARIEGQLIDQVQLAKQVLSWITCARRPLKTTELRHALAVEVGESQLDSENLPQIEDMVSVCAGLVTVDEESNIIWFVHYTTQKYFERTQKHWFSDTETDITEVCVSYLLFDTFEAGFCPSDTEFGSRLRENMFYDYAARNWGHHARAASAAAEQLILSFLKSEDKVSSSSQAMMASKRWPGDSGYSQRVPRQMIGVHIAAYFGLSESLKALFEDGEDLDVRDSGGGTSLWWAAARGHETVVKLLLEEGADASVADDAGETALYAAASNGHDAVMQQLLENDAEIDASSHGGIHEGHTALYVATEKGYEEIVRLLMEWGADISVEIYGEMTTALHLAAMLGRKEIMQLLLEYHADANIRDDGRRTPLHRAAWYGKGEVVRLLLDAGLDVNALDFARRTTLHSATYGRKEEVALLLLNNGADIFARDDEGGMVVHRGAASGMEVLVRAILKKGVEVNARDDSGQVALHHSAVVGGREEMLRLLQHEGTDVNTQDYEGLTALHRASFRANTGNALVLLENGADVNARDCEGWTALHHATRFGGEKIAVLLLDRSADVFARDNEGQTALHTAARWGNVAVVQLLLQRSADIGARDVCGWTALHKAARFGEASVMRLLLESGAKAGVTNDTGQTALHLAACRGSDEVVQLLLANGADINKTDCEGRTALHYATDWRGKVIWSWEEEGRTAIHRAAMSGNEALVQQQLDSDMWSGDCEGRTPLQRAAEKGQEAIVRLLLRERCDVDDVDSDGRTVLHDAVERRGNVAVVQLLLEEDADVSIRGSEGRTVLHRAVWKAGEAVIRVLLENGADVDACDDDGRTVLDEASTVLKGVEAVAKLLLETQTDINSWCDEERKALHDAIGQDKETVVRLLLSQGAHRDIRDCQGRTPIYDAVSMLKGVALILHRLQEEAKIDTHDRKKQRLLGQLDVLLRRIEVVETRSIICPSAAS